MSTRQNAILALVLALPAPGCCSLAQLFCGPDDSEWVQIDFRTPRAGLATFMEAVLKDDCQVIYDSLAETFKQRQSLGLFEGCVFWERLKEEQSGLHLLGFAEVTELASLPGRAAYQLEYSGYRFRVELVEQQLWTMFTDLENAAEIGRFAEISDLVQWPQTDGQSVVIQLPDPATIGPIVELEDVQEFRISREWKVNLFAQIADSD